MSTTFQQPNKRERDRIWKRVDALMEDCGCPPENGVVKLCSPGAFDGPFSGTALVGCSACAPMLAVYLDRLHGGHEIRP
jgi:hypothetical protein